MGADFAATLAEVECLNLVTDAKITADWDVQFTKLREINSDLTRRRRLRAEALTGFESEVNSDYATDILKNLVLGAAKDEGTCVTPSQSLPDFLLLLSQVEIRQEMPRHED
jgi:hypothetical protein